uniref:Uncharacterized protein n=1 Tax=Trypanosoma congolense (strain IL3000) TaxID=1068625 RepID=G0UYP2_TRYCI|nr:conserved hypothetical protein [Trypanosoma congolense IL3000]
MVGVRRGTVTTLFEIASLARSLPMAIGVMIMKHPSLRVYHEPPLQSHAESKECLYTFQDVMTRPWVMSLDYEEEEAVSFPELHGSIFLRYQLNPLSKTQIPDACYDYQRTIFCNMKPYLRLAYVEVVDCAGGSVGVGTNAGCSINVCTETTGIFSDHPQTRGGDTILFSTVPSIQKALLQPLGSGRESPFLIVDDVFIGWGSTGFISLNDLSNVSMLSHEAHPRVAGDSL